MRAVGAAKPVAPIGGVSGSPLFYRAPRPLTHPRIHAEPMTAITSDTTSRPVEATLAQWTYDPWRERPRVAWVAALSALALCLLVLAAHEPFLIALSLCLFCVGSFAPALAAVEVRLDAQGIARRGLFGWERRAWRDVRRIDELPAGLLLSPYARRHVLDATRGWSLPMPAAERLALRASVRRLWEATLERA